MKQAKTLVVGIGEVGAALADVLEQTQPVLRLDLEPQDFHQRIGVMHLCIPYQSTTQFQEAATSYIQRFEPALTIVNSTVVPGTVRAIAERTNIRVAYSPVRGKHRRMAADLLKYTKCVAAPEPEVAQRAEEHFRAAGMTTRQYSTVETLELAKLAETTYFGVLIAFAQELNRLAVKVDGDYTEVTEFFREVEFLPRTQYFPGWIGGHCVIPNIKLLNEVAPSVLFQAVLDSNDQRAAELAEAASSQDCPSLEPEAVRSNR